MGEDPYEVLDVERDSSEDEIKEAYREKIKQCHPDVCDKENAEELFMRVKDAYETLQSGGSTNTGLGSGSSKGKKSPNTGANSTKQRSERGREKTGSKKEGSKKKQKSESTSHEGGSESRRKGSDARQNQSRQGGGFGVNSSQWNIRSDECPDDFEVTQRFDDGWLLGMRRGDNKYEGGRWFVFKEFETAPHVDEKEFMFLAGDGAMTKEPTYFETSEVAKEAYRSASGKKETEEDYEYKQETKESHRKYSPKSESYTHVSTEKSGSFADEQGWGEKRKKVDLDPLWGLYYQEKNRGDEERWAVIASVIGDGRFVNDDGEYQETEFWFEGRKKAEDVHRRYMRRMSDVGEKKTNARSSPETGPSRGRKSVFASAVSNLDHIFQRMVRQTRYGFTDIPSRMTSCLPKSIGSVLSNAWRKVQFIVLMLFLPAYMVVDIIKQTKGHRLSILFAYIISSVGMLVLGVAVVDSLVIALGITVTWLILKFTLFSSSVRY